MVQGHLEELCLVPGSQGWDELCPTGKMLGCYQSVIPQCLNTCSAAQAWVRLGVTTELCSGEFGIFQAAAEGFCSQ